MFIGSAPGISDKHEPFEGYSARDFNRKMLPKIGLDRERIYLTNIAKCAEARNDKGNIPDAIARSCVTRWLWREIETVNPKVVVLMGSDACRILDTPVDLDQHHGIPSTNSVTIGQKTYPIVAFPIIHPATTGHDAYAAKFIMEDLISLRLWMRGMLTIPTDHHPSPIYREVVDPHEVDFWWGDQVAMDTETLPSYRTVDNYRIPWSLQWSPCPGTGLLVRSSSTAALDRVRRLVSRRHGQVVLHNALYDLDILGRMQIYPPNWIDTMQIAYHTAQQYQSLKWLAFRLCGMEMQEIADMIKPYADDAALEFLMQAAQVDYGKADQVPKPDGKMKQPQALTTKIKKILTDYGDPAKAIDLRKRWFQIPPDERAKCDGLMPLGGIDMVPSHLATYYACRDTDATIRVLPRLLQEAGRLSRLVRLGTDRDRRSAHRDEDGHALPL